MVKMFSPRYWRSPTDANQIVVDGQPLDFGAQMGDVVMKRLGDDRILIQAEGSEIGLAG